MGGGGGGQLGGGGGGLNPGAMNPGGGGFGGMLGRPLAVPTPGALQRPGSSLAGSGPGMQQVLFSCTCTWVQSQQSPSETSKWSLQCMLTVALKRILASQRRDACRGTLVVLTPVRPAQLGQPGC